MARPRSVDRLPPHLVALERLRNSLPEFSESCLKIKPKVGDLVPLKLSRVQLYLHQRLEEQKQRRGLVRAIVLKGRQTRVSTYISARFYWLTTMHRALDTFILSYHQSSTDYLFDMVKRFYDNCPGQLRPVVDTANAKRLRFPKLESGYEIATAGSAQVGRGRSIQLLLGDEAAFWANAPMHFAGVVQGVPMQPGTEIILPSTANGVGNEFHKRWHETEIRGSEFEGIFIPWWWAEDYELDIPGDFRLTDDERTFLERHAGDAFPPTVGNIVWRRRKRDELGDDLLLQQEYPDTPAAAFENTGTDSFILAEDMARARAATCEPFGALVGGADPARFGGDRFSLAFRQGRKVLSVESKKGLDTVAGAGWIKQEIDAQGPDRVFIDLGGQGAGVYDILQSWGEPYSSVVVGVNFGGSPQSEQIILPDGTRKPGPRNRRAEMWMRYRTWLRDEGGADVPDSDSLQADSCAPGYSYDMNQRLLLEAKEHMSARGLFSPDEADSVCLTFAEPVRVAHESARERSRRHASRRPGGGAQSWLGN